MFRSIKPFFIIVESSLHPGSGSELGIIDLPIQRERHTNFPKIEGSGLKGSIREAFENCVKRVKINSMDMDVNNKELISLVFGPEKGEEHAGAVAFTDAKILLFPVKSLKGLFGWVTCPHVLERFKDDLRISEIDDFPKNTTNLENTCPQNCNLPINSRIILEEYSFDVRQNDETTQIAKWFANKIFPKIDSEDPYKYWREKLEKDLVILSDDDFKEFVTTSTEVIARTVIDNTTGTADNLWNEEYLPQDTILYSVVIASPIRKADDRRNDVFKLQPRDNEAKKVMEYIQKGMPGIIQIGGNQTLGKGIVRLQILG